MGFLFDRDVLTVTTTVSIWISVVPVVVLVALKRDVPASFVIAALAFLSSVVVGDAVQRYDNTVNLTEGAWLNTWVWPPVQFAVLTRAVIDSPLLWWAALALIALTLWLAMPERITYPDASVTIVGSMIVCAALYFGDRDPLTSTLLVYCGLGSIAYFGYAMLATTHYAGATYCWYAYQCSRIAAFALFGRAVWKTT